LRLSSELIQSQLQTKRLGRELLVIDECTSTNDEASRIAERGARHGYTVLAEKQTHGRGRQAREWISPEGGIWMTTVLRPTSHFSHLDGLPLIGALATAVVLSSKQTVKALVRRPNDVMFQDRKLAGTMVEAKFSGNALAYALLGLGLNAKLRQQTHIGAC
jgi:BirA family biotin operon repressor/biotin-[acetyl-CoA-carboxylase] ligase